MEIHVFYDAYTGAIICTGINVNARWGTLLFVLAILP